MQTPNRPPFSGLSDAHQKTISGRQFCPLEGHGVAYFCAAWFPASRSKTARRTINKQFLLCCSLGGPFRLQGCTKAVRMIKPQRRFVNGFLYIAVVCQVHAYPCVDQVRAHLALNDFHTCWCSKGNTPTALFFGRNPP